VTAKRKESPWSFVCLLNIILPEPHGPFELAITVSMYIRFAGIIHQIHAERHSHKHQSGERCRRATHQHVEILPIVEYIEHSRIS